MIYKKLSTRYEKTEIATAGKIDLVVLCYEKAIQSLQLAIMNYEANDYAAKAKAFTRAIDIINELQCSLDRSKGGVIADNLDAIYSYLTRRLIEADIKKDISVFKESVHILSELKEAWTEIIAAEKENIEPVSRPENLKVGSVQIAA